jgi:hypothetical protein
MEFINLTPHAITVEGIGTIEPSGTVARVNVTACPRISVGGVRVMKNVFGNVSGLPAPQLNTVYIVSAMVLNAIGIRAGSDVFAPDTGADAVRNDKGHIVAVKGLVF